MTLTTHHNRHNTAAIHVSALLPRVMLSLLEKSPHQIAAPAHHDTVKPLKKVFANDLQATPIFVPITTTPSPKIQA